MKTYVLTLSKTFPKSHKRFGEETLFRDKFKKTKLHTIRANFGLWEKRFNEIKEGKAKLSIRQWSGSPYKSKQEEIAFLSIEDGIGIQELKMIDLFRPCTINGHKTELPLLASNDGLSFNDWYEWFKRYDLSSSLVVIHFTDFRY